MVLGKLDFNMQKNAIGPLSYAIYENHLKLIKDSGVIFKSIKLPQENIGGKLYDIGLGNNFFDMTPETQTRKSKNRQVGLQN